MQCEFASWILTWWACCQCCNSGFVDEKVDEDLNVPIEEDKPLDQIRQTPLNLPDAFEWDTLDITNASIVSGSELCVFLDLDYCDQWPP